MNTRRDTDDTKTCTLVARGLPSLVVKMLSCLDRRSSQFNKVILKRNKGVAFEVPCRLVALGSPLFDLPLAGSRCFESLTTEDDEATNECPQQAPYNIHKDLRPSFGLEMPGARKDGARREKVMA
jgi:hypothetical protein